MVTKTRHTGIVVSDMDQALKFYRDLLGISKVVLDRIGGDSYYDRVVGLKGTHLRVVMLELDDGTRIELLQYLSHPRSAPARVESCDIGCSHIALEVADVGALCEKLTEAGLAMNCPPLVDARGYAKVSYVHDYDGTIVELVQILDDTQVPYREGS